MSDRKVKVESTVRYSIALSMPDFRFSRIFSREGQTASIDFEIIEEGLQRPGFRNIFKRGLLRVVNKQDRIDLGLEAANEDDDIEPILSLNSLEIAKLLKGDQKELDKVLARADYELLQRFVQVVLNSKITDYKIIQSINKAAKAKKIDLEMTELLKLATDAERPLENNEEE